MSSTPATIQDGPPLEVIVLDVGHGNSTIVRDGSDCAVIDAAPGSTTADELDAIGCRRIEHLVLSHADKDHIGSAAKLLLDDAREIGTIWFNADGQKNTQIWQRLLHAVDTRHRHSGLDGHQAIHTASSQQPSFGRVQLQVLHPPITFAGRGPSRNRTEFGVLSANTLSVVLRVLLDTVPAALLAGDMDAIALQHSQDNAIDLTAPVLVFPHHGGLPGTSASPEQAREFARAITRRVRPDLVIFSIRGGRNPANPNPEILAGVREEAPEAHIACTQLSIHCHAEKERAAPRHLSERNAAGLAAGRCCAGTIVIRRTTSGLGYEPTLADHRRFTESLPLIPLCRRTAEIPAPRDGQRDRNKRPRAAKRDTTRPASRSTGTDAPNAE